jgi:hypothetical protein
VLFREHVNLPYSRYVVEGEFSEVGCYKLPRRAPVLCPQYRPPPLCVPILLLLVLCETSNLSHTLFKYVGGML